MVLTSWVRGLQGSRRKGKKEADKYIHIPKRRCRGSAHKQLGVYPVIARGCNLWYGRCPEQTPFQESCRGARKQFQKKVPSSPQNSGRYLVHGINGSEMFLLLGHINNCGWKKGTHWTGQLHIAEVVVRQLLLLGSTALHRHSSQIYPDTQCLGSPEKSSVACGLPRWFATKTFFQKAQWEALHHLAHSLPGSRTGQAGVGGGHWESYSTQLHWRTSLSAGTPFPSFCCYTCLKRVCSFPRGKVENEISTANLGT